MQSYTLGVVGSRRVGKTHFCVRYANGELPAYMPTFYLDDDERYVTLDGTTSHLRLWDHLDMSEAARLQSISFLCKDLFIFAFSCTDPPSMAAIRDQWLPATQVQAPNTPFVVLCLKIDLRDDAGAIEGMQAEFGRGPITTEEGELFADEIGAVRYLEASAMNGTNVVDCVLESLRIARGAAEAARNEGGVVKKDGKAGCIVS